MEPNSHYKNRLAHRKQLSLTASIGLIDFNHNKPTTKTINSGTSLGLLLDTTASSVHSPCVIFERGTPSADYRTTQYNVPDITTHTNVTDYRSGLLRPDYQQITQSNNNQRARKSRRGDKRRTRNHPRSVGKQTDTTDEITPGDNTIHIDEQTNSTTDQQLVLDNSSVSSNTSSSDSGSSSDSDLISLTEFLPDYQSRVITQSYRLQLAGLFAPISEQDSDRDSPFGASSPLSDRTVIECLIGATTRVKMDSQSTSGHVQRHTDLNDLRLTNSQNIPQSYSTRQSTPEKELSVNSRIDSAQAAALASNLLEAAGQSYARQIDQMPQRRVSGASAIMPIMEMREAEERVYNEEGSISSRLSTYSDGGSEDSGFSGSADHQETEEERDLRRRSTSMVEAKEQTYHKLKEELEKAQAALKLRDEEIGQLDIVKHQMNEELTDLTASLFEEANKMVQDANVKRMRSEKLLAEARSQNEVLQAEVQALKELVLTSTPAAPNVHLHPQIDRKFSSGSKAKEAPEASSSPVTRKMSFKKTHKRSTSHHIVKNEPAADFVFDATKPAPEPPVSSLNGESDSSQSSNHEDPSAYELFLKWRENPTLSKDCKFINRILIDDVTPCLTFPNHTLSEKIQCQVQNNLINIEPIAGAKRSMKRCPLLEKNSMCTYRLKMCDGDDWLDICEIGRNRITAVCELFTYLNYVKNGLIKNSSAQDMFWHIMDLRKSVCMARLGFTS